MRNRALKEILHLKRPCRFLLAALCALPLIGPLVQPSTCCAAENDLRFTHTQRSLQPGEVVLYDIRSTALLKELHLEAFGRRFRAFREEGVSRWKCLVGIDRDTEPGRYGVRVAGLDSEGRPVSSTDTLVVQAKDFPTRNLTVEPKYVTPPPDVQKRIERERVLVDRIFQSVTREKLWFGAFLAPVPGEVISAFGKRSIYNGQPRSAHSGTDFRGAVGVPVRAPNAGRIVYTGDLYYTGNTVIIDHGLGIYSYLGHMSSINTSEGKTVKIGDIVGKVGATGRVTGPHLHWTVRLGVSRVDPISLMEITK